MIDVQDHAFDEGEPFGGNAVEFGSFFALVVSDHWVSYPSYYIDFVRRNILYYIIRIRGQINHILRIELPTLKKILFDVVYMSLKTPFPLQQSLYLPTERCEMIHKRMPHLFHAVIRKLQLPRKDPYILLTHSPLIPQVENQFNT